MHMSLQSLGVDEEEGSTGEREFRGTSGRGASGPGASPGLHCSAECSSPWSDVTTASSSWMRAACATEDLPYCSRRKVYFSVFICES